MEKETHAYEMKEVKSDILEAVGGTIMAVVFGKGIPKEKLRLTMARDAYEELSKRQSETVGCALVPWDQFVTAYKKRMTDMHIEGVRVVPAEWGTGWTLREKRKKGKR